VSSRKHLRRQPETEWCSVVVLVVVVVVVVVMAVVAAVLVVAGFIYRLYICMLCLRFEDAFVITCVANLKEVEVLYVQQDLRYEISSHWCFNV
jgi:hypothetical protein